MHQSFLPKGFLGAIERHAIQLRSGKAKAILKKAGLNNVTFKLSTSNQPPYLDIAQALQGSFAKAGVKVEVVPGLSSEVSTNVKAHKYEATPERLGLRLFRSRTPMPPRLLTTRKMAAKPSPSVQTGTFLS